MSYKAVVAKIDRVFPIDGADKRIQELEGLLVAEKAHSKAVNQFTQK